MAPLLHLPPATAQRERPSHLSLVAAVPSGQASVRSGGRAGQHLAHLGSCSVEIFPSFPRSVSNPVWIWKYQLSHLLWRIMPAQLRTC